ncbi:cytochrome c family protein [Pseudomonas sp. dw_358]|uniref:c-type cytochrome n=1 Tax=Pseudomonas sp. dw_358 TaxID=2720083 RepID=UPI001BD41762|nr:cytochrome c family protein [Pseudomonas sp. dw_358]
MKSNLLILLLALTPLAAVADGDATAGQAVFESNCTRCHTIGSNARNVFGPQLNGLFGRKAGTAQGYHYTDAMRNSGIVWSTDTLAAFVKDPSGVVSGTRMQFWGLSDAQKVADLLAYLKANPVTQDSP